MDFISTIYIIFFRSILVLCGTGNTTQNIPHIQEECEKYLGILCGILSVPHNIVIVLNNVM